MEFEDNRSIQNSQIQKSDNALTNILLIALGAAIVYFLLKGSQDQQPAAQTQAQYENDEQWHIQRGDNGFIEDLRVGRHANVGNGNIVSSSENYIGDYGKMGVANVDTNVRLLSDKEKLDKYIKNLVTKNLSEFSISNNQDRIIYNDRERRRRFGMS